MLKPRYIGVTGFMTPQEVRAGLQVLERAVPASPRKLMVGVLVSSKTLAGNTNKYPNRYPKVERIGEIFQAHPLALNLVHYNTDDPETLAEQLVAITKLSGEHLHGFQLNVVWPTMRELERFQEATEWKQRLVLQVGGRAMAKCNNSPKEIADTIGRYAGSVRMVDDILIDPSGGKGEPFDPEKALNILREVRSRGYVVNFGIAGGLGPGPGLKILEKLLDEFPDLNIDAEGRIRTVPGDDLHVETMGYYIEQAAQWLGSYVSS